MHIHGNRQRLRQLEGEIASGPLRFAFGARAGVTPTTHAAFPFRPCFDQSQRVFAAAGRNRQGETAHLSRVLRRRLHRVVASGHEAVDEASVCALPAIVVFAVLVAELAIGARAPEQIEIWMHVAGQFDGDKLWRGHGKRVQVGSPLADDRRLAAFVPSAGNFHFAGNVAERRLALGGHFPIRRAHDVGSERLVRGHHSAEPGRQRNHDHGRATKHCAAVRSGHEGNRSEHQQQAYGPGQRRRAGSVEINAHTQNQRVQIVDDVVGASFGRLSAGVVKQQADCQRCRHHQLKGEVDHSRADARDPPEQDIIRISWLRIGEDNPDAPKRVADVEDREAKQHRYRRGAYYHRQDNAGSAFRVHRHPRRGQNAASHCDLSNQRHRESVRENRHAARPDQHRCDHREQTEDRAWQDSIFLGGLGGVGNEHVQRGQENQHAAQHDVRSAQRQRGGRKPEASQDGEQQRPMRPRAQAWQHRGVRKPRDRC